MSKVEVEYRNSWIIAIILFILSVLFPITTFLITYRFDSEISVFWAFPFVHLWWFVPSQLGYFPFFIRRLMYHPRLMRNVFWLMFLWPPLIFGLVAIDHISNLWMTRDLFSSASFVSGALPSIIALVAAVLPLLVGRLAKLLNEVDVEVLGIVREIVLMSGIGESFHVSPEVLEKGLPIVIRNRAKRAVVVSHIFLGVTSLNVPINFKTRSGRAAVEYEEKWRLPEWVVVQSESSEILYVPWQKVVNASLKAQEITQKVGKRPSLHVGIYDPFPNKIFWSKQVNHQALMAQFSHLEWMKKHPDWGKE